MIRLIVTALIAMTALLTTAPVTVAEGDNVVLVVSGRLGPSAQTRFTRAELEVLPQKTIRTHTPWHEGLVIFEGPLLKDVMELVGAKPGEVEAVALNDYRAELPTADFAEYQPILALKRDGQYMSVRDKGPLFIMYPYDDRPEIRTATYYARGVWQVRELIFR